MRIWEMSMEVLLISLTPALGNLNTGFGLLAALLSFASPKESNQRKGEPKAVALRATLRYSRRAGSGANSLRSNSARPDPRAAALLSTANGLGSPNTAFARSLRSPCTRFLARCALFARAPRRPLALALRNAVPVRYPHLAPST